MKDIRCYKLILMFAIITALFMPFSGCSSSSTDDAATDVSQTSPENGNTPEDPDPVVYPEDFLAGASVKDISPTSEQIEEGVYLGGFGMIGIREFDGFKVAKATGIHDPLYARAFVVQYKEKIFAIVTLDVCVIGNRVIKEITEKVEKATGIPATQVFVGATHSHASLDLLGYMGGVCKSYRKGLIEKSADAVISAYNSMELSRLYVSSVDYGERDVNGNVIRGTSNRRGWEDREGNPSVDRALNVIEAKAIDDGHTIGLLINLGCHPTIIGADIYDISRDFCGYLADHAEALTGAPVVFVQGAMGDARATGWNGANDFEVAKNFGENIAEAAVKSLDNKEEIDKDLFISRGAFNVKLTNFLLKVILGVAKSKMELDYDSDTYEVTTQVNYVRLGSQVQLVTLPGEPVTHLSLGIEKGETGYQDKKLDEFLGIKQEMTAPFKMVCGITGDTLLYLVPQAEWNLSPDYNPKDNLGFGYEEMMSINKGFAGLCAENAFELMRNDPW